MKRVAIAVERMRTCGRSVCEGVAAYAQTKDDWSLAFVDPQKKLDSGQDGFIGRVLDDAFAARIQKTGKPAVDVYCQKNHDGIVGVDADHIAIAKLAARHLITRRFRHFAFCGYDGARYSDVRKAAFVRCIEHNRCTCSCYKTPRRAMERFDADVISNERIQGASDEANLRAWLLKLPVPCAVFCCHDLRAYQLIEVCKELGISVPREIAVLGVDDDHLVCSFTTPMISSVDPNSFAIGWTAARTLDRLMRGESVGLRHEFVVVKPKDVVTRASTEVYPIDPPWLSDALVFIRRNVIRSLNASDIYAHVRKSSVTVERAFRKALGTTLQHEIMNSRLEEAEHLLRTTGLAVGEVAKRSGFKSSQYFCRAFVAAKGCTPLTFRNEEVAR